MELKKIDGFEVIANPREFNGQFFFTNPDTEDFTFNWDGIPYTFPAMSTSPFIIMSATPIETQEIRHRAAEKLARRMFGKSNKWKELARESSKLAKEGKASQPFYDQSKELAPYIQKCLEALPLKKHTVGKKEKIEKSFSIDPNTGKRVTSVYGEQDSGTTSLVAESQGQ